LPALSTGVVHGKKEVSNFENFVYPVPEITQGFSTDLSRGKTWSGKRTKLANNMPHLDETVLWVFEPTIDGKEEWKSYAPGTSISLRYIRDFTYRFCFLPKTISFVEPPENSEKNPISTVTIQKRVSRIAQD
jgi:hypothetical protein